MAELERGVRDESRILNGRIFTAPDGGTQAQAQAMANTLQTLKGGHMAVAETTAGGFGQSKAAAPKLDWVGTSTGQRHDPGNQGMRDSVQASIASAYGVPASYMNPNATAPGLREAKRLAFLDKTLPLASLIAEELSAKLTPAAIQWDDLASQSVDVHLRARAIEPLATLGANKDDLLRLVGLPLTVEAQPEVTPATVE